MKFLSRLGNVSFEKEKSSGNFDFQTSRSEEDLCLDWGDLLIRSPRPNRNQPTQIITPMRVCACFSFVTTTTNLWTTFCPVENPTLKVRCVHFSGKMDILENKLCRLVGKGSFSLVNINLAGGENIR